MKNVFFVALLTIIYSGHANAEITTKKQADQFITKYCISLVNDLQKAEEMTNDLKSGDDIENDEELAAVLLTGALTGAEINNIIDTYIKLCK